MNKTVLAALAFGVALVTAPASAQSIMQEPDFSMTYGSCSGATAGVYSLDGSTKIVPWREGYVVAGQFDYWFDGKLFCNLMRLDERMQPDASWTPPLIGLAHVLAVDRDGALLVGGDFKLGEQSHLVKFRPNGTLDDTWKPTVAGKVFSIAIGSDGLLFIGGAFSAVNGAPRKSLAKFRADGTLDSEWGTAATGPNFSPIALGWGQDGVFGMFDAGADGIISTWKAPNSSNEAWPVRLARDGVGEQLPLPAGLTYTDSRPWRDAATGTIYATPYLPPVTAQSVNMLMRMLPGSMEVDPSWGTKGYQASPFAYWEVAMFDRVVGVTPGHVYACRQVARAGLRLMRFDQAAGQPDATWLTTLPCVDRFAITPNTNSERLLGWDPNRSMLAAFSTKTLTNEPRTVVEYYSRVAKRFFITSRPNEQAALDAMPTTFVRTGMQFAALNALVQDSQDLRMPICRFYAPSSRGASNTHFYGSGSDCQTLKRYSFAVFEGYDFRAGVPVSGACTRPTPTPVYRLFNDLVASNNANHRYVVSDARREEMFSAGWKDEGLAFCASDAADSGPLSGIVQ